MRFATFILFSLGHVMLASLPVSHLGAQEAKPIEAAPPVPRAKPMLMRDHSAAAAVRTELGKTDAKGELIAETPRLTGIRQTRIRETQQDSGLIEKAQNTIRSSTKPDLAPSQPVTSSVATDPAPSRVDAKAQVDFSTKDQKNTLRDTAPKTSKAKPLQFSSRREFLDLVVKPKPKNEPSIAPENTVQIDSAEPVDQSPDIATGRRTLVRTSRVPTPAAKPQNRNSETENAAKPSTVEQGASTEAEPLAEPSATTSDDETAAAEAKKEQVQTASISLRPRQKPVATQKPVQQIAVDEPTSDTSETKPTVKAATIPSFIQPKPKPLSAAAQNRATKKQEKLKQEQSQKPSFKAATEKQPKKAKPAFAGFLVRKSGYTTPTANGRRPEPFAAHNESFQACLDVLSPYKISFERVPNQRKNNGCQIINGLKIKSIEGVEMKPAALLNCDMALRTAKWIQKLQPLAATYFASSVTSIGHMSAYSCRFRSNGKISEHGLGNALDVGSVKFSNGKRSTVLNHWYSDNTPERDAHANFWYQAAGAGCEAYQLLLSPVSNAAHKNHLHLDAGHWRLCER